MRSSDKKLENRVYSEEVLALKAALLHSRENSLNDMLAKLRFDAIDEDLFQLLLKMLESSEQSRFRILKALESQEVIDEVLRDRLI